MVERASERTKGVLSQGGSVCESEAVDKVSCLLAASSLVTTRAGTGWSGLCCGVRQCQSWDVACWIVKFGLQDRMLWYWSKKRRLALHARLTIRPPWALLRLATMGYVTGNNADVGKNLVRFQGLTRRNM